MSRFLKISILAFLVFGFTVAPLTLAQTSDVSEQDLSLQYMESIADYSTDITINKDATINVIETINYNFGTIERHGIIRNIPYKYSARGGTFKLRLSNISVTDEKNQPLTFKQSYSGNELSLKIGDADKTITGTHIYKIAYTVNRAINYFDDHDELYWNAIGLEWTVPIAKSSAIIHAPANISKMQCFTGVHDSKESNCSITGGNTETVTFTSTKQLEAGEGLTIVAGLPEGTIAKPTVLQNLWNIFIDNGILLLPFFVFALMFYFWNKYGRDARSKNSIVAQYESPDNLSAMYMGTLLHGKTEAKDLSAEIIYLATQGYLTIQRIETKTLLVFKGSDYELTRTEKATDSLAPQTKEFFNELFKSGIKTIKISDLKTDRVFGTALVKIKNDVVSELVKDKYWRANPITVASLIVVAGIFFAMGGSFLLGSIIGYLGTISAIISGLIIIIFGFIMPALTQKGADTVAKIKGLELYMTVAEKDRMEFHNAPEKNPQHFEMLLPFAVALGVESKWAAQFKDLANAPSWYNDSNRGTFNALVFANSMNSFSTSMQSVATSATTSSSGGSGFSGGGSGGGGGGGGGGSW